MASMWRPCSSSSKRHRSGALQLPPANDPVSYPINTDRFIAASHATKLRAGAPFPSVAEMQQVALDTREEMETVEQVAATMEHLVDQLYTLQRLQNPGKYWGGVCMGTHTDTFCCSLHLFENPARRAFYKRVFVVADELNQHIKDLRMTVHNDADRSRTLPAVARARDARAHADISPAGPAQQGEEEQGHPLLQPTP